MDENNMKDKNGVRWDDMMDFVVDKFVLKELKKF